MDSYTVNNLVFDQKKPTTSAIVNQVKAGGGFDFSDDTDDKSQSIDNLINQFEQVKNQPPKQPQQTSTSPKQGLAELIREEKLNMQSRQSSVGSGGSVKSPVMGLSDLIRAEKMSVQSRQNSVGSPPQIQSPILGSSNINSQPMGLKDLIRAEKLSMDSSRQNSIGSPPKQPSPILGSGGLAQMGVTTSTPPQGLKDLIRAEKLSMENKQNSIGSFGSVKSQDLSDSSPNWSIYVYTSNISGAGTDANVYIKIFGNKAESVVFNLDKKVVVAKDSLFEIGQCDKFEKRLPDIGKPIRIKIGHDNKGAFPGWHLDKV